VGAAECSPGFGDGEVELFVADTLEELGVGGGTTSANSSESAPLAENPA
jgi:hypothetical protein